VAGGSFAGPADVRWPLIVLLIAVGTVAIFWTLQLVWRLHGVWRIRRAGPRPLLATRHRIWRDVHSEEPTDLRWGRAARRRFPRRRLNSLKS
jgi:hypothetical protein